MSKKSTLALIFNILATIASVAGFVLFFKAGGNLFMFYTEDSNLLAGIVSLIFVIYLLKYKDVNNLPTWLLILRYVTVTCLTLTFLVVVFVLVPTMSLNILDGLKHLLFSDSMLFHHFLCPVLSTISFIFFEGDRRLNKKKTIYFALIPTFIYGLIMIVLNILKVVVGPYPFLMVYRQAWYMSIIWIIVILGGDYLISRFILLFNQQRAPRIKRN